MLLAKKKVIFLTYLQEAESVLNRNSLLTMKQEKLQQKLTILTHVNWGKKLLSPFMKVLQFQVN